MKVIKYNHVFYGVNGPDGVKCVFPNSNVPYDEMLVKQLSVSDIKLIVDRPNYVVRVAELGLNLGGTMLGYPQYPNTSFNIRGVQLPITWTFKLFEPDGTPFNTDENIIIIIEFLRYEEEQKTNKK